MLSMSMEQRRPWAERHECLALELFSASGLAPKGKGTH